MNKRQRKWIKTHYDIQQGFHNNQDDFIKGYKISLWEYLKCCKRRDIIYPNGYFRYCYLVDFKNQKPKFRKLRNNRER